MTAPLPVYEDAALPRLSVPELLRLMAGDEDRVPRNVIDECARRGEEMASALEDIAGEARSWTQKTALGDWWLRLHAVMILGLIASERAGFALVRFMRCMAEAQDESLQGWLAGRWPALFANKPPAALEAARALAADRGLDWYMRVQAVEVGLAAALALGAEALERAIDAVAAIVADESEDATMRFVTGNTLLDFPRPRHRPLLARLVPMQKDHLKHFAFDDVERAYARGRDTPDWQRLGDPWMFYAPAHIAERQRRWAKDDARAELAGKRRARAGSGVASQSYQRITPKVGRNEPCPCGSGKKFKHCCLAAAPAAPEAPEDLTWRRLRRLLDEWQRDMLRFVTNVYGQAAIEESWRYFVSDGEAAFEPESRDVPLFMPWFYHCWSPEAAETRVREAALHGVVPTAAYLRRKKRLDPLLREYLESCLASPFSVFEIVRADPGRGLLVQDLFTGAQRDVAERSASALMQEGDLIFGQLAQARGVTLLEASQAFVIAPIHKIEVIRLRQRLCEGAVTVAPERVRRLEDSVLELYHEIAERLFERRLPALQNTDGEPLSLRRVVFDVPSAQEAFDALKHLAEGDSEEDLLREARRGAGGGLKRVRFSWLKRGNAQNPSWENTVLGSIEIDGTRLAVEVNSEAREKSLRTLVAEALGERARYRATEIQSLEKLLAEAPAGGATRSESAALAELPEVKAKMAEIMAKHYEQWVNDKIPALGGRTPLEAVTDPAGREAVRALVQQIERDGARMAPPLDPAIVRRLRERLRLA